MAIWRFAGEEAAPPTTGRKRAKSNGRSGNDKYRTAVLTQDFSLERNQKALTIGVVALRELELTENMVSYATHVQ